MGIKDWLLYLCASFIVWLIASFLKELNLRKDPETITLPGTLVFYLTVLLFIVAFPVTLLASFGVEHLLLSRIEGNDEESYKAGYSDGYDAGYNRALRDSSEAWDFRRKRTHERFYEQLLAQKQSRSKQSRKSRHAAMFVLVVLIVVLIVALIIVVSSHSASSSADTVTSSSASTETEVVPSKSSFPAPSEELNDYEKRPVWVLPSGEKYHLRTCSALKGKDDVIKTTRYQAEASGYTPCKRCCP